jgi:hypothetical protein
MQARAAEPVEGAEGRGEAAIRISERFAADDPMYSHG